MTSVDAILQLSGPFTSDKARRRYRGHLQGLSEKNRGGLLNDLQKDAARPAGRSERGWKPATSRQNFHHA